MSTPLPKIRYSFGDFVISPSRRQLLRAGRELPLIPRYFDLLLLFLRRRNEAISRREILETVWYDVVVSDGALSQAVRILRRTLGDDKRGQAFIRTVPRHGYRFVFEEVLEQDDAEPLPPAVATPSPSVSEDDPITTAVHALLESKEEEARREAAETLHGLGTAEALRRIDRRPSHAAARALLRDARWDVPHAGPVPLLGQPGFPSSVVHLISLRIRHAMRLARNRWLAAAVGGGLAGVVAGVLGSLVLRFGPGSLAGNSVLVALPLVGAVIGGLGASGVGAGLAAAEAIIRSSRGLALVLLGALGGGLIGAATHFVGRLTLEGLFGRDLSPLGGGMEGVALGAAAGLGYALSTPRREGGMATPRGGARLLAALVTGLVCALAGIGLAFSGGHMGAMSLDFMASSFPDSQVGLLPLSRLLGEAKPGPLTAMVISAWEGLIFGFGLVLGLTHRPR